jgi:hypothetical protein
MDPALHSRPEQTGQNAARELDLPAAQSGIKKADAGRCLKGKFYEPFTDEQKTRMRGEVHRTVAPRDSKYQSNFVEVRALA